MTVHTDLSTALLALSGVLLAASTAWALLVAALACWRPTARWAAALTPRALRAILFTGVTGAVALSPVRASAGDLDGLPLPDRPVTSTQLIDQTVHVVAPGDSLWTIAATHLDSDASPAVVAAATGRWYQHNRELIGPDRDLIHPGQKLTSPTDDLR